MTSDNHRQKQKVGVATACIGSAASVPWLKNILKPHMEEWWAPYALAAAPSVMYYAGFGAAYLRAFVLQRLRQNLREKAYNQRVKLLKGLLDSTELDEVNKKLLRDQLQELHMKFVKEQMKEIEFMEATANLSSFYAPQAPNAEPAGKPKPGKPVGKKKGGKN